MISSQYPTNGTKWGKWNEYYDFKSSFLNSHIAFIWGVKRIFFIAGRMKSLIIYWNSLSALSANTIYCSIVHTSQNIIVGQNVIYERISKEKKNSIRQKMRLFYEYKTKSMSYYSWFLNLRWVEILIRMNRI